MNVKFRRSEKAIFNKNRFVTWSRNSLFFITITITDKLPKIPISMMTNNTSMKYKLFLSTYPSPYLSHMEKVRLTLLRNKRFLLKFFPSKMLQNLQYFYHKKTHVVLFIFHFVQLYFFPNECPGLCRHFSGHLLGEKIE